MRTSTDSDSGRFQPSSGAPLVLAASMAAVSLFLIGSKSAPADPAPVGPERAVGRQASAEVLDRGRELYVGQCQSCHGREGKGDGPAARFVDPPPRDLTAGEWTHVESPSIEEIVRVVTAGIDETDMLPFEELMTEEEILAVATYVHEVLIAVDSEDGSRR